MARAAARVARRLSWTWPLTLWIIPALLGQPFLRAFLLAEHAACPAVSNMLENSPHHHRRPADPLPVMEHVVPRRPPRDPDRAVPPHQELTYLIAQHLKVTSLSYVAAHREIRAAWTKDLEDLEPSL